TIRFKENLYLGTNQGLFYRRIGETGRFSFVEDTGGQVWSLHEINNELFCGHHNGTFLVTEGQATLISDVQGTWDLKKIAQNTILQGNYDGLYILKKTGGTWSIQNKLDGFSNSARRFALLGNRLFVNHEYKGLYEMTLSSDLRSVKDLRTNTTLKSTNSGLTNFRGDVLYCYDQGVLRYRPKAKLFEKDSFLSSLYDKSSFLSGNVITSASEDEIWFFKKEGIVQVRYDTLNDPFLNLIPLHHDYRQEVIEFENILPISGKYIFGTTTGYTKISSKREKESPFKIIIDGISNGINPDHSISENLVDLQVEGDYQSEENNFNFSFHAPSFKTYYPPNYQYRLVGMYDQWSEWSPSSSVFYENLPSGKFTFEVRAKVGLHFSQNIANYEFRIKKPWYLSNLMILLYVLAVVGFSVFMHNVYRIYYKREQQKLIEKNQKELALQKLQNEKEKIELQNQQLEQENKSKSNELAASTMSIIKKNEVLNQIKEQLIKVPNLQEIKPVIKTIDKNLNQRKNWELFKEAFNNADRDFFNNLTTAHPELSPNDLRLCAYLRLNLSSKEIAGLINISPRSVEVKRYRLRKKLGLDSNENLANYVMNI
ncbi:MAG: triple tyrosine motif-containing protein, partial [Bacteroidota bacterium]